MSSKTETSPVLMAKPEEENQLSPNPAGFGFTKMLFVDSLPVGGELKTLYALKVKKDGEVIGYSYFVWDSQTGFAYAPFAGSVPNMKVADGGRSRPVRTENAPKEAPEKVFYGLVVFQKEPMIKGLPLSEYIDKTGGVTHAELEAAISGKVDKVAGMGLSHNDYSDTEEGKVTTAYNHSQASGNPHATNFSELNDKPTTLSGYGITGVSLGLHTDGLLYVFDNGVPIGNGIALLGDVVGNVDSSGNIVLSGNIPSGTYTVKYEMDDNSTIEIGELVIDRSVTNNLTYCTNSNDATSTADGESYSATISAISGYTISSVAVTMGGVDITSTAVSGGTISITEVTGDIIITAVAVQATNFADPSSSDWIIGGRISNSAVNGIQTDAPVAVATNYIPVEAGDVLYFEGCNLNTTVMSNLRYAVYTGTTHATRVHNDVLPTTSDGYVVKLSGSEVEIVSDDINYFRMTIVPDTDSSAVVINIKRNGEWL